MPLGYRLSWLENGHNCKLFGTFGNFTITTQVQLSRAADVIGVGFFTWIGMERKITYKGKLLAFSVTIVCKIQRNFVYKYIASNSIIHNIYMYFDVILHCFCFLHTFSIMTYFDLFSLKFPVKQCLYHLAAKKKLHAFHVILNCFSFKILSWSWLMWRSIHWNFKSNNSGSYYM